MKHRNVVTMSIKVDSDLAATVVCEVGIGDERITRRIKANSSNECKTSFRMRRVAINTTKWNPEKNNRMELVK